MKVLLLEKLIILELLLQCQTERWSLKVINLSHPKDENQLFCKVEIAKYKNEGTAYGKKSEWSEDTKCETFKMCFEAYEKNKIFRGWNIKEDKNTPSTMIDICCNKKGLHEYCLDAYKKQKHFTKKKKSPKEKVAMKEDKEEEEEDNNKVKRERKKIEGRKQFLWKERHKKKINSLYGKEKNITEMKKSLIYEEEITEDKEEGKEEKGKIEEEENKQQEIKEQKYECLGLQVYCSNGYGKNHITGKKKITTDGEQIKEEEEKEEEEKAIKYAYVEKKSNTENKNDLMDTIKEEAKGDEEGEGEEGEEEDEEEEQEAEEEKSVVKDEVEEQYKEDNNQHEMKKQGEAPYGVSGIPTRQVTASIGSTLWTDKPEYVVTKMPEELLGSTLFQPKYYVDISTIEIFSSHKAKVWIGLNEKHDGGLMDVLPKQGWKLENGSFIEWNSGEGEMLLKIWSTQIEAGQSITFATTKNGMIFDIFVSEVSDYDLSAHNPGQRVDSTSKGPTKSRKQLHVLNIKPTRSLDVDKKSAEETYNDYKIIPKKISKVSLRRLKSIHPLEWSKLETMIGKYNNLKKKLMKENEAELQLIEEYNNLKKKLMKENEAELQLLTKAKTA